MYFFPHEVPPERRDRPGFLLRSRFARLTNLLKPEKLVFINQFLSLNFGTIRLLVKTLFKNIINDSRASGIKCMLHRGEYAVIEIKK